MQLVRKNCRVAWYGKREKKKKERVGKHRSLLYSTKMGSSHGFRNLGNIRREINEYTTEGLTVASIKLVETILYETESTGLFTKITRKWFIQRKEDSIVIQDPLNPLFRIS